MSRYIHLYKKLVRSREPRVAADAFFFLSVDARMSVEGELEVRQKKKKKKKKKNRYNKNAQQTTQQSIKKAKLHLLDIVSRNTLGHAASFNVSPPASAISVHQHKPVAFAYTPFHISSRFIII